MMEKLFDKQAAAYAKGRLPSYPASLFERLASLTERHERAWDVGTGNGQAAIMLADHYKSVVATDVSEPQLSHAVQRPNIVYSKMSATPSADELERVVGGEGSVDLITVASALHYFDLDNFYPIVKRLLRKPGGVVAAWTSGMPQISPEIDKIFVRLRESTMAYRATQPWTDAGYRTIPFPFAPANGREGQSERGVEVEILQVEKPMTMDEFVYMCKSSPAVQKAHDAGFDVVNENMRKELLEAWGPADYIHTAKILMFLLVGTVSEPVIEPVIDVS